MQLTKIIFIGTSAEYAAVRQIFESPAAAQQNGASAPPDQRLDPARPSTAPRAEAARHGPSPDQGPSNESTYDDIVRVLRHTPIRPHHLQLFHVLYERGDAYSSRTEIATLLHVSPEQLNGVLGSLARRIRGTPDLESTTTHTAPLRLLLDTKQDNGEWHYRLQPNTRKALEAENLI